MKKILIAALFLMALHCGAQTINPNQIRPGTANQCLVTVGGVTTWTACTGASGITSLTGDVTATGPGAATATLSTVNGSPGTCGDSTHVCQVTTNGKGLTTGQSSVSITPTAPASPSGSVQYNNSGVFGGSSNATLDSSGNLTAASVNHIVYSTDFTFLENAVAQCNGVYPCVLDVTSNLSQSTAGTYTTPNGLCIVADGGVITNSGGKTLSFSGNTCPVTGKTIRLFANGTVVAGMSGDVQFDWFGSQVYPTFPAAAAGTDSLTQMQACLTAIVGQVGTCIMQPGYYRVTNALTFTGASASGNGIKGANQGYNYPTAATTPASVIVNTSAGNDTIHAAGSAPYNLTWITLKNFGVGRSVCPTGTAAGIYLSDVGGANVENVQSQDSVMNWYLHGVPDLGLGHIRDTTAGWGHGSVTGCTGTPIYGYYSDSADGVAQDSLYVDHCAISNGYGATPTVYGIYITGTAINDQTWNDCAAAVTSYSSYVNYTGSGSTDSTADIHINQPIFDGCEISCVYVTGIPNSGTPSVSIVNGYLETNTNNVKIVDVESSYGVTILNNQIAAINGNSGDTGVYANGGGAVQVVGNRFQSLKSGFAVQFTGATTGGTIAGNTCTGTATLVITTCFNFTGSTGNALVGNQSAGNYTTGYSFDGTSLTNNVGLNGCTGTFTTCTSGVPLGSSFVNGDSANFGSTTRTGITLTASNSDAANATEALSNNVTSAGAVPVIRSVAPNVTGVMFDYVGLNGAVNNNFTFGFSPVGGSGSASNFGMFGLLHSPFTGDVVCSNNSIGVGTYANTDTCPNTNGLTIKAFTSSGTNGYGVFSVAPTGATNNYAFGSNGFTVNGSGLMASATGSTVNGSLICTAAGAGGGFCNSGTPGTVTNIATTSPITGGPITTTGTIGCATCGVTGSPLSQFAATTSTQLAGVISDETGSGALVFAASPVLSGIPQAPTATLGTNSTQIATTNFVNATLLGASAVIGAGSGVTSATCLDASDAAVSCTSARGSIKLVGGTATTGTIATVTWSAEGSKRVCVVTQNGNGSTGTSSFDLGHTAPSTTGFSITAGLSVLGATIYIDYNCQL